MRSATARSSPTSITPAPSPGPTSTQGASVGKRPRYFRDDLYEQCSDHITEYMASSTSVGSRPSRRTMALNSSSVIPSRRCLGSSTGRIVTGRLKPSDLLLIYLSITLQDVLHIERETGGVNLSGDTPESPGISQGEQESR